MTDRRNGSQQAPLVIRSMGSGATVAILGSISSLLGFLYGYFTQEPLITYVASMLGSFLMLGYYLYKPFNFFSDNFYAQKAFHKVTDAELRGLGFLNSPQGKLLVVKLAAAAPLVPTLGALCWLLGFRITTNEPPPPSGAASFAATMVIGAFVALMSYIMIVPRILCRRWKWIEKHQPLPPPRVIARYAKGRSVGSWDHFYGTDFSKEIEEALQGRSSRYFWLTILQIFGGAISIVCAVHLLAGTSVREQSAVMIVIIGSALLVLYAAHLKGD